jgi:hypothetical protein
MRLSGNVFITFRQNPAVLNRNPNLLFSAGKKAALTGAAFFLEHAYLPWRKCIFMILGIEWLYTEK